MATTEHQIQRWLGLKKCGLPGILFGARQLRRHLRQHEDNVFTFHDIMVSLAYPPLSLAPLVCTQALFWRLFDDEKAETLLAKISIDLVLKFETNFGTETNTGLKLDRPCHIRSHKMAKMDLDPTNLIPRSAFPHIRSSITDGLTLTLVTPSSKHDENANTHSETPTPTSPPPKANASIPPPLSTPRPLMNTSGGEASRNSSPIPPVAEASEVGATSSPIMLLVLVTRLGRSASVPVPLGLTLGKIGDVEARAVSTGGGALGEAIG